MNSGLVIQDILAIRPHPGKGLLPLFLEQSFMVCIVAQRPTGRDLDGVNESGVFHAYALLWRIINWLPSSVSNANGVSFKAAANSRKDTSGDNRITKPSAGPSHDVAFLGFWVGGPFRKTRDRKENVTMKRQVSINHCSQMSSWFQVDENQFTKLLPRLIHFFVSAPTAEHGWRGTPADRGFDQGARLHPGGW
jgi:hypothetical protein